jgi:hypothetical protein
MTTETPRAMGPAIIELRRYRLHPGARESLIELFDREFIETQEELGMEVLGQFRDIDDPDSFVWLRGFADMVSRAQALARFYGGPVWAAHREVANGTMINSDNVLLLLPTSQEARSALAGGARPGSGGGSVGFVLCTICNLAPNTEEDFAAFFDTSVRPLLMAAGANVIATMVTERSANAFPRLPVREGETVFVWLTGFPDIHSYAIHVGRLARSQEWTCDVLPAMERRVWRPNDVARLAPTARSRLRG